MAARPDTSLEKATLVTKVVKAASTVTLGMPVTLDATDTVLDSTTGQNPYGVAITAGAAGERVTIAIFGGPVPVKVGTVGATLGGFASIGTTGAIDQTFGGGTTLAFGLGKFTQTGASGDFVGILVGTFASVKA